MSIRIASGKRNWPSRWKTFQRGLPPRSLQGRVLFSFLAPTRTKKNLNKKRFIVHSHRNDDHHQALRHRPPRRPPGDPRHHPRRACRPRIRRLVRRSLDRLPPHVRRCRHRPNTRRHRGPRACLFLPLADTHTLPHKPPTATLTPPSRHPHATLTPSGHHHRQCLSIGGIDFADIANSLGLLSVAHGNVTPESADQVRVVCI